MQRNMLLSGVLTLSLLIGSLIGAADTSAQEPDPIYFDALYFPWVPNNGEIDGTGPWHGSITVQNIDRERERLSVRLWAFNGTTLNRIALNRNAEGGPYSLADALDDPAVPRFDLDANASVTLDARILGLSEPGSAVVIFAVFKDALDPDAEFGPYSPTIAGVQKQASPHPMSAASTTSMHRTVDGYSGIPFPDIAWGSQSDFCYMIRDGVDSCDGTGLHTPSGVPEGGFDGHSYLPIVQTNSGWNTEIYLSNVDFTGVSAGQVSITLTRSQGADSSGVDQAIETVNIPPGGTAIIDVRALVGDGWTGSAHMTSTVGIGSLAMRSKSQDEMLMINTSAPSLLQARGDAIPYDGIWNESAGASAYHQYAPLVFRDYNGWNTGFSFVNIAEQSNRVTISYIGADGGVSIVDSRAIPARGHAFVYIPASSGSGPGGQTGDGFVGAAHFHAEHPFHVAIDQVKYSTGEAMSYLASATGAEVGDSLAVPLVQKGWLDGSGDTSGFQILNPAFNSPVTYEIHFFDSAGAAISPTRLGPLRAEVGPREVATTYTLNLSAMAQNQRASAVLTPVEGDGWIIGVSNNVNYSVGGDGSVAFNLVNQHGQYRLSGSEAGNE